MNSCGKPFSLRFSISVVLWKNYPDQPGWIWQLEYSGMLQQAQAWMLQVKNSNSS